MTQSVAGQPGDELPAVAYQLGRTPLSIHQGRNTARWLNVICFLVVAAFTCFWGTYLVATKEDAGVSLLGILFGLGCLIYGLYEGYHTVVERDLRVIVMPDGFVLSRGSDDSIVRWGEIEAIWESATTYKNYGIKLKTIYRYTIQLQDSRKIVFTDTVKDIEKLGQTIQREVTRQLLPQALRALNYGQSFDFGKIGVSRYGITISKKTTPWEEIRNVEVSDGFISVARVGKPLNWVVNVRNIPNVHLFLTLVNNAMGARNPDNKGNPMQSLEKAIQTFMNKAVSSNMDLCLTIEGKKDSTAWIQMTWNSLNISFRSSLEPLQYLNTIGVALPKGSELVDYDAGSFATFSHNANDIPGLTQFARQYFLAAFNIALNTDTVILRDEALGEKKAVSPPAPAWSPASNSSSEEIHRSFIDLQNQIRQLLEKAATLRASGQWAQTVDVYSQIISLAPKYVPAYVERGLLVHEMGYPEKAFPDFEQAIHLDPQCGMAYYGRGWVKHTRGDFNGEMQDARKGLSLDQRNAGMYYRRMGAAHQGLGQYREAIEAYNEAINFYPGREEGTIYNRGLCYLEMKEYTAALADFNRSLEMDPDWAWAFAARGRTYLNLGDCKKAIADCDMAIKYKPNYIYSYLTRGLAYEKSGDKQKARTDFEYILKITESSQLKELAEQHLRNLKSGWGWFR